jgi:hypothetical protein
MMVAIPYVYHPYRRPGRAGAAWKEALKMSERVKVKVLLLVGDEAEVVADAPDATVPERYPVVEIASAVGAPREELPGMRLTARVGVGDRLFDWRRA